jgi:hypothetical protein
VLLKKRKSFERLAVTDWKASVVVQHLAYTVFNAVNFHNAAANADSFAYGNFNLIGGGGHGVKWCFHAQRVPQKRPPRKNF